ncbi:hypothetical protein BH23BAC1_BH23BAC1_05040 [soil metagenome]
MIVELTKKIIALLLTFTPLAVSAQSISLPPTPVPLDNMTSFESTSENWQIVGEVIADREKDHFLRTNSGKGTLVNIPKGKNDKNLISAFEHGDIELELEFMVTKGSNSGVYLQGRYEVQIFDSWGVKNQKHSDAGGIYQRWDEEKQLGYEGRPARVNVSKAPGLWQHYKIIFEAPRFNAEGKKVKNARFVQVIHNGVLIHENVEVSGPTRAAQFNDERAVGPLMLQGDHGPVAFRNISYKKFDKDSPRLADIRYKYYEGKFEKPEDFAQLKATEEGRLEGLTWNIGHGMNDFVYQFSGNIEVKEAGAYLFTLEASGRSSFTIEGNEIFEDQGQYERSKIVELEGGKLPFTLTYYKSTPWRRPGLGLFVEGPGVKKSTLHAWNSYPEPEPVNAIYVKPSSEPLVLRGFVQHKGKKKTHTVTVGEPGKINYAMDLQQGALLNLWRGDFVDATPMWHNRGESQLVNPLGGLIELSGGPTLAILTDKNSPWPDSLNTAQLRIKGYDIDNEGRPKFKYIIENIAIEDYLFPEDDSKILTRIISFSNPGKKSNLWVRIAEGENISQLQDGSYNINKGEYYVGLKDPGKAKAMIRNSANGQELVVPINQESGKIQYSFIW